MFWETERNKIHFSATGTTDFNTCVVKSHQDTHLVPRYISSIRYNYPSGFYLSGVSKSVIKTMSIMDFEKVNLELIEALLEWIVDGKHSYPPGNCFLSSFMCKMAKGKELTSWDRGHPLLPGALTPPQLYVKLLVRLFRRNFTFYVLRFTHFFYSALLLSPNKKMLTIQSPKGRKPKRRPGWSIVTHSGPG